MIRKRDEDIRILYIANNPVAKEHPIAIEREEQVIRDVLTVYGASESYPLYAHTAASIDDLHDALIFAPNTQVLHLAGHGSAHRGLLTTDGEGNEVAIAGQRLAQFLTRYPGIRLVVLGACHQWTHAWHLAQVVQCVVGTSAALDDDAALAFTRALYKELAVGSTVGEAVEAARAVASLGHGNKADVIVLAHRDGIDPNEVQLTPRQPTISVAQQQATNESTRIKASAEIDGINDVIITANTLGWRHIVPHDRRADPVVVDLDTGDDGWQRTWPPDPRHWSRAAEAVRAGISKAKAARRRRIHVAVKMPFELGALLASGIEQHNREVVFYQESPAPHGTPADRRTWQAWGPGLADARPEQRRASVFEAPLRPDGTYEHPCDVALLASVTQRIDPAFARAAIEAPQAEIQTVQLIPHAEIGPAVIDVFNIDKAAEELQAEIERTPRLYPAVRAIHLFYAGPLALLMRAAGRLHVQSTPIYLYAYFPRAPEAPRYVRTFELGARRLMLPGAE